MQVTRRHYECQICHVERQESSHWFLVAEGRWQDTLKILKWNEELATRAGIHPVCGAAHAEELIAQWVTTGSLEDQRNRLTQRIWGMAPGRDSPAVFDDGPEASGVTEIGELVVHREGLARVLDCDPETLVTILDAIAVVLQDETDHHLQEGEEELALMFDA